jgi:MFS family permease
MAAPAKKSGGLRTNLTLWVCSALHCVNDAFFAVIFPLLPLLAVDLDLSYAEVGLVKSLFSGASSAFQLPIGLLAERWGEYALLVGGNAWVAGGLIGMGLAASYLPLLALTVLGGLGGNTQHPLAAALVSRNAPPGQRATAVGTLNFAGDLGKIAAPVVVALIAIPYGWRAALIGLGVFGLLFSVAALRLPIDRGRLSPTSHGQDEVGSPGATGSRTAARVRGWGIDQPLRFSLLGGIGLIDSSTRGAALVFLPFVFQEKGLDAAQVSWLLTAIFVGGALGKFGCGPLADRFGTTTAILLTELVTVGALALFPGAPILLVPALALAFGFVLNGTSSVLYAMVADLVPESRRSRGYGLYYTLVNGSSAVAPVLYGMLGDREGLLAVFVTMAVVNALTLPLTLALGRARR